jgi:lysyl-tRNA synthetase class 2
MLEWYRQGFDDFALMDELEALIGALLAPERRLPAAERQSYAEALRLHAGVDAFLATDAELAAAAARHGHSPASDLDRDARLDLLMGFVVGPKLGRVQPTFICDYPASQASLARLKPRASPHAPQVAARFELYIDGLELANGFHELANASEQRQRFSADLAARVARDQQLPAMDENLLAALDAGLPDCAGVALGLDRVLALATGANSLADVVSFDINRA